MAGAGAQAAAAVPRVEYHADPGGRMTLEQVSRLPDAQWNVSDKPNPSFGYTSVVYWFRTTLRNDGAQPQRRLYEIAAPLLDHLDVHVLDEQQRLLQHWALGDKRNFESRPVAHRHFVVPIDALPQQTLTVLARVATEGTVQMPVRVWTPAAFEHQRDRTALAQGAYFGLMLAMLAYNLFLLLSVRDISYLWYVLWIAMLTAFVGSLTGLSFQYLWPQAIWWNDTAIVLFLSMAMATACLFTRNFLALKRGSRAERVVRAGATVMLVASAGTLLMPYAIAVQGVSMLAVLLSGVAITIAALRLRDGFAPARYYLIAWSFVLTGGVVIACARAGLLPINEWTDNAPQIGSAFEAVLLSLALAARFNNERRLREQAQAESLRSHREANERLEQRVQARTVELELANAQLHELIHTDGLTGVHNRRHLDEMLLLESQRASRSGKPLGILLIDIDHFKRVNDEHGHAVGDECLKQVARAIRQHAKRSIDLVARYGGEEFCAVMPGIDAREAMLIAERLREQVASTPFEVDGRRMGVTVSLGVCCRVPSSAEDAHLMLKQADAALYASKRGGRNRVTAARAEPGSLPTSVTAHV